jgi:hypothetical protein
MKELSELLERFRRGGELVQDALEGTLPEEIDYHPEPHAWSVRQIAAHLADSEVVAGWRVRRLIADSNPTLEAFDEKRWATHLGYERRDPQNNLAAFLRMRAENYDLLAHLTPQYFENEGTHVERGRLTLNDMVRINTEHAERHAAQIHRVRDHYRSSTSNNR